MESKLVPTGYPSLAHPAMDSMNLGQQHAGNEGRHFLSEVYNMQGTEWHLVKRTPMFLYLPESSIAVALYVVKRGLVGKNVFLISVLDIM